MKDETGGKVDKTYFRMTVGSLTYLTIINSTRYGACSKSY